MTENFQEKFRILESFYDHELDSFSVLKDFYFFLLRSVVTMNGFLDNV
jgi:hypothetical protein